MEKYRNLGLKLTPQRLAILDFLENNRMHPSAEEIFVAVSKRFPTMSFATVYNTLDALRRKGEVRELTIDPEKKRFDPDTSPHHHLICVQCGSIADIFVDYDLRLSGGDASGYEVIGKHVEFYGICPGCRKRRPASAVRKRNGERNGRNKK